jgi:hypothetical protein
MTEMEFAAYSANNKDIVFNILIGLATLSGTLISAYFIKKSAQSINEYNFVRRKVFRDQSRLNTQLHKNQAKEDSLLNKIFFLNKIECLKRISIEKKIKSFVKKEQKLQTTEIKKNVSETLGSLAEIIEKCTTPATIVKKLNSFLNQVKKKKKQLPPEIEVGTVESLIDLIKKTPFYDVKTTKETLESELIDLIKESDYPQFYKEISADDLNNDVIDNIDSVHKRILRKSRSSDPMKKFKNYDFSDENLHKEFKRDVISSLNNDFTFVDEQGYGNGTVRDFKDIIVGKDRKTIKAEINELNIRNNQFDFYDLAISEQVKIGRIYKTIQLQEKIKGLT